MWSPARTAPPDLDLQLAVIGPSTPLVLPFPCRRVDDGWVRSGTEQQIEIAATHWRPWPQQLPLFEVLRPGN